MLTTRAGILQTAADRQGRMSNVRELQAMAAQNQELRQRLSVADVRRADSRKPRPNTDADSHPPCILADEYACLQGRERPPHDRRPPG